MILITGATGNTGPDIVKAVLSRGERVRVLARNPEKAARLLGDEVEIARGDLADPQSIEAAMEEVDRTFLASAPAPDQVALQSNVISAAKSAGVRHIVKLSAGSADAKSDRMFSKWHGATEDELKRSGIAWTILRPTFFMQNMLALAGMIKGGAIYQPTGSGKAAFVDVRDIAEVAASALTEKGHESKTYEITGPETLSYADVARIFSKVLGREVKHVDVPLQAARDGMIQSGMPPWLADGINELSQGMAEGKFDQATDVVQKVGHKQPITLEQFVRENQAAFS